MARRIAVVVIVTKLRVIDRRALANALSTGVLVLSVAVSAAAVLAIGGFAVALPLIRFA